VCVTPQQGFSWRLPRRGAPVKRPRWNSMSRPTGRTDKGFETVPTPQAWISQTPTNLDIVAPIKARAWNALQAVLRSKPRQADSDSRIMRRGAERC